MEGVQLEARELDDQELELCGIAEHVEHRHADVAAWCRADAGSESHMRRQLRCRRLPVRSGDCEPGSRLAELVAQAPGEFDVSPDWRVECLCGRDERVARGEAGRRDDQVGTERVERRNRGLVVLIDGDGDIEHLEDAFPFLVVCLRDDVRLSTELGQRVGDGEPRLPETEDRNGDAVPVVVPAAQGFHIARHVVTPHSA